MSLQNFMDNAAKEMEERLERGHRKGETHMGDSTFANDWNVSCRLHGCLINAERNREILDKMPHQEFLDLSLVYALGVYGRGKMIGSVLINNGCLEGWGVEEADLHRAMWESMENDGDATLEKMETFLRPWLQGSMEAECEMYVLTNKHFSNGAVQMLNKRWMNKAADAMGTDSFAILPSSVHEVILVPDSCEDGDENYVKELAGIVREVNDTQVPEPDILSYHVYRYSRETGKVTIAA